MVAPLKAEDGLPETQAWTQLLLFPSSDQITCLPFTEERRFPFRRFPKRYAGEMYRSPNGELAIRYTEPTAYTILLLDAGVTLVETDRVTQLGKDHDSVRILKELLSNDPAMLTKYWRAEPDGESLRLFPRDDQFSPAVKSIDVKTANGAIKSVTVKLRDGVVRQYFFTTTSFGTAATFDNPFAQE